jgi:hypothetical protein
MEAKPKLCKNPECNVMFKPRYSTLEKFCSFQCANKSNPKKSKSRSKKRSRQEAQYLIDRVEFLNRPENRICPVFPEKRLRCTEIHHRKGRIGSLLLDQRFWLAVSSEGHQWIENNPDEALKRGWRVLRTN